MGFVKVVVLDADSSPMLMFVASDDSHVKKQPTAANAENVARGAMCTPALPRIAIAERRETWIVWVCTKCCWGIIHAYHQRAQLIWLKFTTSA